MKRTQKLFIAILCSIMFQGTTPHTRASAGTIPIVMIGDTVLFEGNSGTTNAVFTVSLSTASTQNVEVAYATLNDTALANTDFRGTNGTLVFSPGITALKLSIAVNGDTVQEPHETFLLQLSSAINATIDDRIGVATIRNDDGVAGILDYFTWDAVPSPQMVSTPFPVALTARDALGEVVRSFDGTVELSAFTSARPSSLVISEVDAGFTDQVEFVNVTSTSLDLSRWQIAVYDALTWPAPRTVFTIPSAVICPPQGIFMLREAGAAPGAFPTFFTGSNISWNDSSGSNPVAVLLLNASGQAVDFFAAGDADRARITTPILVSTEDWNGVPMPVSFQSSLSYQRRGSVNHHGPEDWVLAPPSLRQPNPNLVSQFSDSERIPIAPMAITGFTDGTWRGEVHVLQFASNVVLHADDGNGHIGVSEPIRMLLNNDLSISLDMAPSQPQILRQLRYAITVTNSGPETSTEVVLTNVVPANVTLGSATASQGVVTITNRTVIANLGKITGGSSAVLNIVVTPQTLATLTNIISVTRQEADPNPANNRLVHIAVVESECAGLPLDALASWPAEGNAIDEIQGNNGSLQNGATFAPGKIGQGFSFDGIDDVVIVPDHPSLAIGPGQDFSIEAWIKVPVGTAAQDLIIFDKRISPDSFSAEGILLWLSNGRLAAQMADAPLVPNQFTVFISSAPDLRDGAFHHIALSVKRSSGQGGLLFVDGQIVLTFNPQVEPGDLSNSAPVRIGEGANLVRGPFRGIIDDLVFSRRALTSAEVIEVYQAGSRGRCDDDTRIRIGALDNNFKYAGVPFSYELEVFNSGRLVANGIRLTNLLSDDVKILSAVSSQGSVALGANLITADLGRILPGARATITATILPGKAGNLTNLATITSTESDSNLSNNRSTAVFEILPDCLPLPPGSSLWSGEGNANDETAQLNGALQGGTAFAAGKVGRSFSFDGVDDVLIVTNSASLNFGPGADFSLEAWIRSDGASKYITSLFDKRNAPPIVDGVSNGGAVGYGVFIIGGSLGFQMGDAPLAAYNHSDFISSGPNLLDGLFHHVAVTVDRDSITGGKLYVDGESIYVFNPTLQPGDLSNESPLRIGRSTVASPNDAFAGLIDETAVHKRALSAEEIRRIFNLDARGYCPQGLTDRDRDSLPDRWEITYGLNRFDPTDALGDLDRDGVSNLNEYRNGTDPTVADNALKLGVLAITDRQIRLSLDTSAGQNYRIEQSPSIVITDWFPVGGILTGTGSAVEFTAQLDPNTREQFYRARLITP
jgi:uncharacterized repeat protein (TIGR01451 family)